MGFRGGERMNSPVVNVSRGEGEGCAKESKKDAAQVQTEGKKNKRHFLLVEKCKVPYCFMHFSEAIGAN